MIMSTVKMAVNFLLSVLICAALSLSGVYLSDNKEANAKHEFCSKSEAGTKCSSEDITLTRLESSQVPKFVPDHNFVAIV